MLLILQKFESGLITVDEANERLKSLGYELRDSYKKGEFHLYPLGSK